VRGWPELRVVSERLSSMLLRWFGFSIGAADGCTSGTLLGSMAWLRMAKRSLAVLVLTFR